MTEEGEQAMTSLEEMFGDGYKYSDEGQVIRKPVDDGQVEESIAQVLLAHGFQPGVNAEDAFLLKELNDAFGLLFGLENPGETQ